jgi:hypothetical protein
MPIIAIRGQLSEKIIVVKLTNINIVKININIFIDFIINYLYILNTDMTRTLSLVRKNVEENHRYRQIKMIFYIP